MDKQISRGRWLTVQEAAMALNVSLDTVYRMAAEGKLKRRKIGSRVLIDPTAVLPEGASVPPKAPVDLQPVLMQVDIALQQLQLLRQQVAAAIEEGK